MLMVSIGRRAVMTVAVLLVVVGGATACAPEESIDTRPTSSTRPAPPTSSTLPTAVPSPPQLPELSFVPLTISCDEVITPAEIYEFNPNVSGDVAHAATEGGSRALRYGGVTCGWLNQTSRERFAVSIVQLEPGSIGLARDVLTATSRQAGLPGLDSFFRSTASGGQLDLLSGSYWITIESADFLSPADVHPLVPLVTDRFF